MNARHAAEILESHGHLLPEVQSLLEFIQAQHDGKHGRARERWRKSMSRLRVGGRRGRAPGPASRPDPRRACPTSSWSASPTPGPSRPGPSPRRAGTAAVRRLPRAARPGRRRLGRRADRRSTARSPARSSSAGIPTHGREAAGHHAGRGRGAGRAGRRAGRRSSRSATSSGSTRPSRRSTAWRSGPSTSPPSGSATYTFRSTDIGVVLDLMIHDIDLVLSLVPAPVRVGRGGRA